MIHELSSHVPQSARVAVAATALFMHRLCWGPLSISVSPPVTKMQHLTHSIKEGTFALAHAFRECSPQSASLTAEGCDSWVRKQEEGEHHGGRDRLRKEYPESGLQDLPRYN